MKQKRIELVILAAICLIDIGCQFGSSAPQTSDKPSSFAGESKATTIAEPTHSQTPKAQAQSRVKVDLNGPREQPLIDQDSTAGPRGVQMVNFVLTLERKPVEGALINIVSNDGQDASSGKTSDWGEFHTGLALGAYTVSITWNGKTTVQNVNIDITTKRVELRLDPQE